MICIPLKAYILILFETQTFLHFRQNGANVKIQLSLLCYLKYGSENFSSSETCTWMRAQFLSVIIVWVLAYLIYLRALIEFTEEHLCFKWMLRSELYGSIKYQWIHRLYSNLLAQLTLTTFSVQVVQFHNHWELDLLSSACVLRLDHWSCYRKSDRGLSLGFFYTLLKN